MKKQPVKTAASYSQPEAGSSPSPRCGVAAERYADELCKKYGIGPYEKKAKAEAEKRAA